MDGLVCQDNDYIDYYQDWNQTLSIPRVIEFRNGKFFQIPIYKVLNLRCDKKTFDANVTLSKSCNIKFDVESDFVIKLNNVVLSYKDMELCLDFISM